MEQFSADEGRSSGQTVVPAEALWAGGSLAVRASTVSSGQLGTKQQVC